MRGSKGVVRSLLLGVVVASSGCAMVKVGDVSPREYIAQRRGDILSSRHLSDQTSETLAMAGLDAAACEHSSPPPCIFMAKQSPWQGRFHRLTLRLNAATGWEGDMAHTELA
ncbi:hypothetical protein [Luteibacter sahnii]|uniref:hypothetical protein n=1 Tax=Luteibacter sahnii TaxID=3021977 RepID=UPI002A765F72|nr:hypothetical protein [Luteibacter sp. PPL193]MDY1550193.1 hypothetical protein [Luteibacter sp. PPL193]